MSPRSAVCKKEDAVHYLRRSTFDEEPGKKNGMMKQVISVCLLGFLCTAFCLANNVEEPELFDAIVDNEVKKVGEEAVLIGNILRECAKGLEVHVAENEHLANETVEYFFKKLWRGAKNVVKKAGKVVEKVGKGIIQTKVADIIKGLIQKKMGGYALAEDESYGGLVLTLAKDMDDLGKALIEKGVKLCGECRRKKLEDAERTFVNEFVSAF
ncbi:uncharacterized protein ISCGN_017706 [Ixodes scapularis]